MLVAAALTAWMAPRGERYSGYDLGPGPFVAVAAEVLAAGIAVRAAAR